MAGTKIVANTENIENDCKDLDTARNAVDAEKDRLSKLSIQGSMLQGMVNLEGVTAEKYEQIHTDLTQAATTAVELMDALIACIRYYASAHEKTDQSSANTFGSGGGNVATSNNGSVDGSNQFSKPAPHPFVKPL